MDKEKKVLLQMGMIQHKLAVLNSEWEYVTSEEWSDYLEEEEGKWEKKKEKLKQSLKLKYSDQEIYDLSNAEFEAFLADI